MVRFNFLLLLFFTAILGQQHPNVETDEFIKNVVSKISNEEFIKANQMSDSLIFKNPQNPFPYIFKAANLITFNFTFNVNSHTENIYLFLVKGIELAEENKIDECKLWNNYALGLAYGYWAYFEALKENYFSALDYGKKSLTFYENCLKIDSTFYEAQIAIATYEYWISEKLGWVPFIKNNKEESIAKLKEAIQHNSYNKVIASISLFWILKNESDFVGARKIIEDEYIKFPKSRYLLSAYANILQKFNINASIKIYQDVLSIILISNEVNRINEITYRHKLAKLFYENKQFAEAKRECDIILSFENITEHEVDFVGERIIKVKELLKMLESN